MVKHVVCHKLTDASEAQHICEMLRGLLGKVPTLRSMEAGVDFLRSERSYNLVLIATFDDREGLAAYDVHPAHQAVRAYIKKYKLQSAAVDFEYE